MNASAPLVLNVDDDAANRYVKTRSLQMGGFQVIEAADGNTALAMTAERQPLLVLLDINLPDLNGLEVCRRIKESWPEIIVIQISATAISPAERIIGLESGGDCYLTTPVEPLELIAVTRAMLRLRNAEIRAQEAHERYR
ncbi:MAG: response regulator transcription factor, partial [Rhodopila sp.]